jgi:hypothetical protein
MAVDDPWDVYSRSVTDIVHKYCASCQLHDAAPIPSASGSMTTSAGRFFGIIVLVLILYVIAVGLTRRRRR